MTAIPLNIIAPFNRHAPRPRVVVKPADMVRILNEGQYADSKLGLEVIADLWRGFHLSDGRRVVDGSDFAEFLREMAAVLK